LNAKAFFTLLTNELAFVIGCQFLQEMIAMLRQMANDGTLEQNSTPVDPEDEELIKFLENKIKPRQ